MTRGYKVWTTREIAFMQDHYPLKGGMQVALELGRSYSSVNQKASLLGLRREVVDMSNWGVEGVKAFCRVDGSDEDSCWLWRGYANTEDYPYLVMAGKLVAARRWMFDQVYPGKCKSNWGVTMSCGHSTCLNPKHMKAMHRQKIMARNSNELLRVAKITDVARRNGKLNDEKVRAILTSQASAAQLAPEMGVSVSVIHRVRRGESWARAADKLLMSVA